MFELKGKRYRDSIKMGMSHCTKQNYSLSNADDVIIVTLQNPTTWNTHWHITHTNIQSHNNYDQNQALYSTLHIILPPSEFHLPKP